MAAVTSPLADLVTLTSPVTLAKDQALPVNEAASALLPRGVLQRGMSITIRGKVRRSLALALAAQASSEGSWVVFVGVGGIGLAAAEEFGLDLTRVALIDDPGDDWATVVAALVGSVDMIVTETPARIRQRDGRRLSARLRERGSVIVELQRNAEAVLQGDVTLNTDMAAWEGLNRGHGRLQQRRVIVRTGGRGAASKGNKVEMWLPGTKGCAELISSSADYGREGALTTYDTIADVADLTARLRSRQTAS